MSSQSIIRNIEKKQFQLQKALATENSDELLNEGERTTLEHLQRMASIYGYQNDTAKGLLQIGECMLKAYDCYLAILNDLNEGVLKYFHLISPSYCKSPKMLMNDITVWFTEFKKTLIRFQTFIRGTSFVEFRLLFKSYYIVEEKEMIKETSNLFGLWTNTFTSKYILKGRIRTASLLNDCHQPETQCHLEILSSDALKLENIDNTPFVILEEGGFEPNFLIYLDHACLNEIVTAELHHLHHCITKDDFSLKEIMTKVASVSHFLLNKTKANKSSIESDFHYIEVTRESACANLEFIESEIENITNFDHDDALSMIENGNILKEQLRKLPSIGNKSIFSYEEKKRFGFNRCLVSKKQTK